MPTILYSYKVRRLKDFCSDEYIKRATSYTTIQKLSIGGMYFLGIYGGGKGCFRVEALLWEKECA